MKRISFVLILVLPLFLIAVTRTVSLDGTQQFTSIQPAVDACFNGDSILVYPGRYIENINLNGHNITLASLYSQNPQQAYIDSTIIDGNLNTCIKAMDGETFTVNGFTLVNNEQQNAHVPTNNGGAFCIWYDCHVYIQNCIIRDCLAKYGGGFSAGLGTILEFSNVIIHSNRAIFWGGGIRFGGGGQLIWDTSHTSSVYDNTAPIGMDFLISGCQEIIDINISLGSREMTEPDSFFISYFDNPQIPNVSILQSFFPLIDNDIYVSPFGDDNNDGLTIITPFKSIRHALQLIASNPDNTRTVHLAAGTYSFSLNGQLLPLSLKPHVKIVGAGTGQTIIDGEMNNTFFAGWNMQNIFVSGMSFLNGRSNYTNPLDIVDSSDILIRELVLSNCQGAYSSGVYLLRCNNIIIENLDIGNTNIDGWAPTIDTAVCNNMYVNNVISHDNHITYNMDFFLGFMFRETDLVLRNSILANNSAYDAYVLSYQNVYPEYADYKLDMSNVLIYNNSIAQCVQTFAPVYLQNRYQTMKIDNCTFANNQGGGYFSNIFAFADVNNLISYNPQFGGELYLRNHVWNVHVGEYVDAEVNINNSLFRTGSIPSDLPNLVTLSDNIMNGNPLFLGSVTDTLEVTQPEYYYLSANSPCINTGTADTTGLNLPLTDLAGNYRIWNNRIDMGCYEYGSEPYTANDNPEHLPLPDKIMLSTYPNPVYLNGSKGGYTFIEFTLPEKAKQQPVIDIYNLKGQKVRSIRLSQSYNDLVRKAGLGNKEWMTQKSVRKVSDQVGNDKKSGEFYSTVWDCKDDRNQRLASGIYLVKVTSGSKQAAIKMTILK